MFRRTITGLAVLGFAASLVASPTSTLPAYGITPSTGDSVIAQEIQSSVTPTNALKAQALSKTTCTVTKGRYCYNHDHVWKKKMLINGIAWSDTHTGDVRKPVPYPGDAARKSKNNGKKYVVYVITRKTKSDENGCCFYKFGITGVSPWYERAWVGQHDCMRDFYKDCNREWVAATNGKKSYYNARYIEASLIKYYQRGFGKCPVGQESSCK